MNISADSIKKENHTGQSMKEKAQVQTIEQLFSKRAINALQLLLVLVTNLRGRLSSPFLLSIYNFPRLFAVLLFECLFIIQEHIILIYKIIIFAYNIIKFLI